MKSKEQAQAVKAGSKLVTTPIAIIGMSSLFPKARNTQAYWDNILRKIDCVTDVPASRWNVDDYYDPNPAAPDKTYCKRGGFIPDVDFDPVEFGLPPNILEVTDVSQLISLVVAKEAMEDAGYDVTGADAGREFDREHTGVILGVVGISSKLFTPLMSRLQYPVWKKAMLSSGIPEEDADKIVEKIKSAYVGWEENAFPGTISNVIAGRIANRFDLGAINCVVDAACGSSLAAIRSAVSELIEGRASMMITGGIDTDNSIGSYMCFSKTPAFSKGEKVRTFDQESDGMMVGEGLGMVVLKRLADAERDGDRIYAVIRGLGSSSDGRYKSIYAPRPAGQARAVRRAYEEAGFSPATVGLMEAHGTGTPAGDPAEAQSMREVFSENNPRRGYIALGSVKSQIAHTKAAAGAASLIKTALALHHKILPPTINVKRPNPKLELENSPFYVNTETRPWIRVGYPRRAGVSSFGFGGTNFHLVLEEYEEEHTAPYRVHTVPQTLILHAETPAALATKGQALLASLKAITGSSALVEWNQSSAAAQVPTGHARFGFVADDLPEAVDLLKLALDTLSEKGSSSSWDHPRGIYYRQTGIDSKGKVVALFAGQGSQYLEMGRELALNFPEIRQAFSEADRLFIEEGIRTVSETVYPAPVFDPAETEKLADALTRTDYAQPAIGTFSVGQYKLMQRAGFQPDFTAGHSFGELTALWAAGVLSDEAYYTLAKARGKAMAPPEDPAFDAGTMLAVKGDLEKLQGALKAYPQVTLANFNSNQQFVLAGSKPAIAEVQKALAESGFSVVPLQVSAAFHTPLVGHAQKPFADAIEKQTFNPPAVPVFSNSTAQKHSSDPKSIKKVLAGHILKPVLYRDEIEAIYAAGGRVFVEFGPKNIQANLVKNILGEREHVVVAMNPSPKKDSDRQLREAYVQLVVAGLPLKDLDPYALPARPAVEKKKSAATVVLNGGLYMSEKTRSAFQKSLTDGHKVQLKAPATPTQPSNGHGNGNGNGSSIVKPVPAPHTAQPAAQPPAAAFSTVQTAPVNEKILTQFYSLQSETVRIQEQYLRNQGEYARTFGDLVKMGYNLFSNGHLNGETLQVLDSVDRSLGRFHEQQSETLKMHEQYLASQAEFSRALMGLMESMPGVTQPAAQSVVPEAVSEPVTQSASVQQAVPQAAVANAAPVIAAQVIQSAPQPAAVAVPAGLSSEEITLALLEVVSEKTGYPSEMLDISMDMEADLGIDSIKRVEILGAMQNRIPELPRVESSALADLRSLGQVIALLGDNIPTTVPTASTPAPAAVQPSAAPAVPAAAPLPTGLDPQALQTALLAIVSEKTGYPTEMLELGMDMEADLGIDSIKRVEILGAMQTQFPELPRVDTSALSDTRTLGQIITLMGSSLPATSEVPAVTPAVSAVVQTPSIEGSAADIDPEEISKALLDVVSEKTGYPAEMIDLNMDMEADLGIDSIKRVEILGAIQSRFPQLPKVEASILTELRTLRQIIEQLGSSFGAGATPAVEAPLPFELAGQAPAQVQAQKAVSGLPTAALRLRALPRPDTLDYSLPEGFLLLLAAGSPGSASTLVDSLMKRGWKVVVVGPSQSIAALPSGTQTAVLDDLSEKGLDQTLQKIQKGHGPVGAFIHLHPEEGGSDLFSSGSEAWVKTVFLMARLLKEPLGKAAQHGRCVFMTVTRMDGQLGLSQPGGGDPVAAGLTGLVKTLAQEWETVHCRALDLSPEMDAQSAAGVILAELDDPDRTLWEVGVGPGGRMTPVVD